MRQFKRPKSVSCAGQFFSSWSIAERHYLRGLFKQFACPKVHVMAKARHKQCGHWPLWANMASKLHDDLGKQVEPGQLEAFFWIVISESASIHRVNRRLEALVIGRSSQPPKTVTYESGRDGASEDGGDKIWNESTDLDVTVAANSSGAAQELEDSSSAEVLSAPVPAFSLSVSRSTSDERGADFSGVLPLASAERKGLQLAAELIAVSYRNGNLSNSSKEVTAPNAPFTTIVSGGNGNPCLCGDNGEDVARSYIETSAPVQVARPLVECADKEVQCDVCPTYFFGELLRFEIALRTEVLRREQDFCARLCSSAS